MSRHDDPSPSHPEPGDLAREGRLLDHLAGELSQTDEAALAADLAADEGALREALEGWSRLVAAEHEAFEPAADVPALRREATRVAAWVRATGREGAREAAMDPVGAPKQAFGWARILGFSLAAHAAALLVLAFVWHGQRDAEQLDVTARVGMEGLEDYDPVAYDPADSFAGVQWGRLVHKDLGERMDKAALMEQERLTDELSGFDIDEPIAWGPPEHPADVIVPMTRRRNDGLKRRRLDLLGFNSQGTMKAVARGLGVLANRQHAETGLFGSPSAPDTVRTTALATLAFLGEGHASYGRGDNDEVVRRAVAGLRAQKATGPEIGPLLVALCEDYMLSYGSLTPNAAAARSSEIEALATRARALLDGTTTPLGAVDRTWLLWGVDATQRAGVVTASAPDQSRFDGWVAAASTEAGLAGDAQAALTVGTALLYAERGSDKPRFKSWSRTNAAALLARLKPTGEARTGDPIRDTALILLALQVSYRTY